MSHDNKIETDTDNDTDTGKNTDASTGQDNNAFFSDNLSIVHMGSKGVVTAVQNYTLKGSVVQATNVSKVEDATNTATKVFFNGYPALNINSIISKSTGDEHTDGGILNGGLKGHSTRFIQGSSNLLIQGHEAVRHTDRTEPNGDNGPLVPIQQISLCPSEEAEQFKKQKFSEKEDAQYYPFQTVGIKEGGVHEFIDLTTAKGDWVQRKCLKKSEEAYCVFRQVPFCLQHRHWLLMPDFSASYPEKFYGDTPAFTKDWENYYPVPLFTEEGKWEKDYTEAELSTTLPLELTAFYPVAQINQNGKEDIILLPTGWLYLFLDNKLWREIHVTRFKRNIFLYSFQDVNLLLSEELYIRSASVKPRLEIILIPTRIKGKEVKIRAHFCEKQLTWAEMQTFSEHKAVQKSSLTEISRQWAETEMPDHLERWKADAPNRPILVIPSTFSGTFFFWFKYTDGTPMASQDYTAFLGKRKFSGQLSANGCSQHFILSEDDQKAILVIDFCEMINLDPNCPYPTHKQEIKLADCKRENGGLIIQVLPPPILLELNKTNKNTLSSQQINYFKNNGNNALLFIHGYNTGLGSYGNYPESFYMDGVHSGHGFASNNPLHFKSSKYTRTVAYDLSDPHELMACFPSLSKTQAQHIHDGDSEGQSETDGSLHGQEACKWFTHMEYNFNKAAGFDGKDYSKYTRILGINWPGNLSGTEYARAEPIAHESGVQLAIIIESLLHAGIEVNIVAHSLGNRVLLRAMELLGQKEEDAIKHTILWQAAVPNLALHNVPKIITNKRLLPCYPNAHKASEKITVLYGKGDWVLGNTYPMSHTLNATPYEHITGASRNVHNAYDKQLETAYPEDYRIELHKHAKSLHEYQRRTPADREKFVDYLIETKSPYTKSIVEPQMASMEKYCKIEKIPFEEYCKTVYDNWGKIYDEDMQLRFSEAFSKTIQVPIDGQVKTVNLHTYLHERIEAVTKVIEDADTASRDQFTKCPAMGYEGIPKDDFREKLEGQGKLQVVDQLTYLTGHSHMKIPSEVLMKEIYKVYVIGRLYGINKFGKYIIK